MTGLTVKQEKFCHKFIETGNASEAYRYAYDAENMKPETIWVKACELLATGKVSVMVDSLKADMRARHEVTVDGLTAELEVARQLALATDNPSAAVAATLGKARLHGLLIEKRQLQTISGDDASSMTDAQLEAVIRRGPVPV